MLMLVLRVLVLRVLVPAWSCSRGRDRSRVLVLAHACSSSYLCSFLCSCSCRNNSMRDRTVWMARRAKATERLVLVSGPAGWPRSLKTLAF